MTRSYSSRSLQTSIRSAGGVDAYASTLDSRRRPTRVRVRSSVLLVLREGSGGPGWRGSAGRGRMETGTGGDAVGWGALALINAGLAQGKNRSGLRWFLISLLLGPVATLLIVIWPPVPASPASS